MAEKEKIILPEKTHEDKANRFYSTSFRKHKIMKAKMAKKSRKINRSKK